MANPSAVEKKTRVGSVSYGSCLNLFLGFKRYRFPTLEVRVSALTWRMWQIRPQQFRPLFLITFLCDVTCKRKGASQNVLLSWKTHTYTNFFFLTMFIFSSENIPKMFYRVLRRGVLEETIFEWERAHPEMINVTGLRGLLSQGIRDPGRHICVEN